MNVQIFAEKTAVVADTIARNNGQSINIAKAVNYISENVVKRYTAMMEETANDLKDLPSKQWQLKLIETNLRYHIALFAKEVADNCQQTI
jgi:hypothetical protein